MDLDTLIAQWSGKLPPGFVPHAVLSPEARPRSSVGVSTPLRSRKTGSTPSRVLDAWLGEPPVAAGAALILSNRADAEDAHIASG